MPCKDRVSEIVGSQGRNIFVPRPPSHFLRNWTPRCAYRAVLALNHLQDQISQSQKLTHSSTGGFGSTNNTTSLFGQNKPAFGSTNTSSAPSLFGNNSASTGFGATSGGFGSNANTGFGAANNNTGSAFSFGSQTNKPAFGSNTGSTLFGQGGSGTTGGFGPTNTAFGSASGTALNQAVPPSEGTGVTPFQSTNEKETNGGNISYQSISFQQPYQKYSFEVCNLTPQRPILLTSDRKCD
jgi:hypothetical protein